jgi:hypothetical protein
VQEGKGREGKGREGKRREGKGREGVIVAYVYNDSLISM